MWFRDLVSTEMGQGLRNIGDTNAYLAHKHRAMESRDFYGARTDLYQDVSEFIIDAKVNYFKRMEMPN